MPKRFKYVSLVAHIGEVDISNFVTGKKKVLPSKLLGRQHYYFCGP
jgi:hypothetical protein